MRHPEAGPQGGRPFFAAEPRSAGTHTQLASLKTREPTSRELTGLTPGDHRPGREPDPGPRPVILEPGLVAIARGKTPDPIPNSAVKTLSADGTASQGAEE